MNYLTINEILDLHTFLVSEYGGRMGIRSQDRLKNAILAPQRRMFGEELYPDIPSKAAALLYLLIKDRPFVSANEATALLALFRFLDHNQVRLRDSIGSSELFDLIIDLNHSRKNKEELEQWLREHCQGIEAQTLL